MRTNGIRYSRMIGIVLLASVLAACGGAQGDLEKWIAEVKARPAPPLDPLPVMQQFETFEYAAQGLRDPFSDAWINQEGGNALRPDPDRRKEPLEAFPLDAMSMVGSVNRKGAPYALLKVDDLLYQVKVGDYLGQNYGKILAITETDITLREIVQDAAGEWIERPTTLQLQEGGR